MEKTIQAVYKDGVLQPLEALVLEERQQVTLTITDPTTDIVPNTNHHIACLNTGLTITDSTGAGVGLCSPDAPLVSLDQPGIWHFSREFTPKRPHVYLNLFNNQWSTNFQQWIGGSWSVRVRIW